MHEASNKPYDAISYAFTGDCRFNMGCSLLGGLGSQNSPALGGIAGIVINISLPYKHTFNV
jgi:hypothetical protein